jgi:hypothetical protein
MFAVLVAAVSAGTAEGQVFPELEPRGGVSKGFRWQFKNGPDFYTYYASLPDDPQTYVGMYFGIHPKFQPLEAKKAETTFIAGRTVLWYDTSSPAQKFRREAIVDYRHSARHLELKLHIWLVAATKEKLSEMMQALSSVQFFEVTRTPTPPP